MKRTQINRIKKRLAVYHQAVAEGAELAREEYDVTCKKGCSHCCRQVVTVSIFEALLIMDWIASDKIRKDWYVKQILPKVKDQIDQIQKPEMTSDFWFDNMIPCVFLKDDGLCSVYEQRPVACRALLVITPVENCMPPSGKPIGKLGYTELQNKLMKEEVRLGRHLDLTPQQMPLPVALHWASIALFQGPSALRKALRGSPFEKEVAAAMYWAEKFGDPKLLAEILREKREEANASQA